MRNATPNGGNEMLTIAMILGTVATLGVMLAKLDIVCDPFGDDDE
jgi:hypothetical protein